MVKTVSGGVIDSGPPRGGGRWQAASVHIRSGGRDRQAECAAATGRRCAPWRTRAGAGVRRPGLTPAVLPPAAWKQLADAVLSAG